MRLAARETDAFLRAPPDDVDAVLVYGPDQGLVRERAKALVVHAAGDAADPFLVAEFGGKDLADQPSRLIDEARALALTGGRRAVWVKDATDRNAETFKALLDDGGFPNLVVAEAGDLPPRSKLRKLFEGAGRAAAIGSYLDDAGALQRLVDEQFREAGVDIQPDARKFLLSRLGNDRMISRQEIEKLVVFAGPGGRLELDDVAAGIGDNALHTVDSVVYAAMDGDLRGLDAAIQGAYDEGINPVQILRAVQLHVQRLHMVLGKAAAGTPIDRAIQELRPPVFFKLKQRFRAQCQRWDAARIGRAMELLVEAEQNCKSSGVPVMASCHISLMKVCSAARRPARP
ncbi:MAG: DNA polymerase III subunit delta [Magnetovibrio sp.]|nr:DNA polymerase III subunit delta [Magnetovibrio sp.]